MPIQGGINTYICRDGTWGNYQGPFGYMTPEKLMQYSTFEFEKYTKGLEEQKRREEYQKNKNPQTSFTTSSGFSFAGQSWL